LRFSYRLDHLVPHKDPIISSPSDLDADLPRLAERFGAIYTAAISDVLDSLGYRDQTLPSAIVPLTGAKRTAGPVFAVEGRTRELERDVAMRRILEMLGAIPAHHVGVYQAGDETCGHFGELSATALKVQGCAGVVIDGGCRDLALVDDTGLPVFARFSDPRDAVGRWEVVDWGHTVEIGGVTAATGDYVVADTDGAVIIPAGVRDQVLELAEAKVSTEGQIRQAVQAGMSPLEAYDRFGTF
jgi:4-hydroxy-4-methyl-2-oxoglutarate aldolase